MVGFQPNLAGIILKGRGSYGMCGPHGGPEEGPKGSKPCKFQTSSSPDPEGE